MPLVYVGGRTGTWAGATSGNNNISLTLLTGGISSTAAIGDIVIAVYATGSAADRTLLIQTPGAVAYTLIDSERYANGTTYDSNLRVAYRILTAADANTVFGPTGNAQDAGAAAVHVWRGVNSTTPLDVTAVGTQGTGTGRPNPPAITPTTTGAVVIATGGAAAATGALFVGTGLSNFITATSIDTNDGMVGVGSFAWTSGTYDPAAWTGGTANAADSWTSITLVLRPAATQTLTPTLFTNTQTFYSPDVTQAGGAQALTPSLYTNDQTFFAPTVEPSNTLTPALYTNDQTFYGSSITTTVNLTAQLYTNDQTFYGPIVAQSGGTQSLIASLYTNDQTFYAPTVSATYALAPALYTNTQTFFDPTVTSTVNLLPSLYENVQTFYGPTVGRGAINLQPALYTNSQSFYAPSITTTASLLPSLFTNTQTFYSATVSQGGTLQTLTFEDYVDPDYVDSGYVTWVAGFQSSNIFFGPVVGQLSPADKGGGGGGVAAPRGKKKIRSSYVQNTAKQSLYAVLQQLDAERQAEVAQIVQPLTTLQQPEAKRIAATVEARSTELDSVKQLYSEIEKLEQDLKQRRDSEQERIALRKMSLELRQLIIEEDELVEAYSAAMAADALALLAVVGVRV